MKRNKFYVVWEGIQTGIYDNWEACKKQVNGYQNAKFKSFQTHQEALKALKERNYKKIFEKKKNIPQSRNRGLEKVVLPSICVDGAWNGKTKRAEFRGVNTQSKEILFEKGPFEQGTNNIAEFLAIVFALVYTQKKAVILPIYSDSNTAIKWVRDKKINTTLLENARNETLFQCVRWALENVKNNNFKNPILKWKTDVWGENPADFGRK